MVCGSRKERDVSDCLDHPAALWPATPSAPGTALELRRWVWSAMSLPERHARLRELRAWADRLRHTAELHDEIPPCWYCHRRVREMLTALYLGRLRTYEGWLRSLLATAFVDEF